jgi:hypothetical protein
MVNRTLPEHAAGKRAAQYLIKNGLATFAEIAALSGRSRQVVRLCASQIDAETAFGRTGWQCGWMRGRLQRGGSRPYGRPGMHGKRVGQIPTKKPAHFSISQEPCPCA